MLPSRDKQNNTEAVLAFAGWLLVIACVVSLFAVDPGAAFFLLILAGCLVAR